MKNKLLKVFFFLCTYSAFLVAGGASADPTFPENYYYTVLSNGLEVLIIEDHSVPLVHLEMAFRAGAFTEGPEQDGLSHLYEHMIFNATDGYPTASIYNDKMLSMGIVSNANTDQEIVNYYFSLPASNVAEGLQLFAQGLLSPLFLEDELEKEKMIVRDEFQRLESDIFFLLDRETDRRLWGEFFSRKNVIGDHQVIMSATKKHLLQFHHKYHQPDNALLIIAGDIQKGETMNFVENLFSSWKRFSGDFDIEAVPEIVPLARPVNFLLEHEAAESPAILYAWPGPDSRGPAKAFYASEVLMRMLNLQSLPLQQELVETGKMNNATFRTTSSKYHSTLYLEAELGSDQLGSAIRAVEKQLKALESGEYFSEDQVALAKNAIVIEEAYRQEELSEFIHIIAYRWASGGINMVADYMPAINRVMLEDIESVVNEYMAGQPRTAGIILSPGVLRKTRLENFEKMIVR